MEARWKAMVALGSQGLFPIDVRNYLRQSSSSIDLNMFQQRDYSFDFLSEADVLEVVEIEKKSWQAESLSSSEIEVHRRLQNFPSGQIVAKYKNKIIGVIYSQRISGIEKLLNHEVNNKNISELHNDNGEILQLIAVAVAKEYAHLLVGQHLRDFMLLCASVHEDIKEVIAVTRCSSAPIGLDANSYQDYVSSGEDPTLMFHTEGGATIETVISNYREQDYLNNKRGVLVSYDLRHLASYADSNSSLSKKCSPRDVYGILNQVWGEPFSGKYDEESFLDLPLMAFGNDSLELVYITKLLEDITGKNLPRTLLFDYPTPRRLLAFFEAKTDVHTNDTNGVNHAESIGVLSMSCRFPGQSNSPDEFYHKLCQGEDMIHAIPESWNWIDSFPYVKRAGVLDEEAAETFDSHFFGIGNTEVESLDPHQRLLLEVSYEALRSANIVTGNSIPQQRNIGVFVGLCNHNWNASQSASVLNDPSKLTSYTGMGTASSATANRISYTFGFTGPSIMVDTACSSSLVAVHLACQSLRSKECETALVCSADLLINPLCLQVYLHYFILQIVYFHF